MKITKAAIRKMAEQLSGRNSMPYKTFTFGEMPKCEPLKDGELSQAVHLDTNGVVVFPGGWMHPFSFRDIAGEAAYQELMKRPRVQSEYTEEELNDVEP
jgi:hypothetical protein